MNSSSIIQSSLWAAYGDAIGFITEFVKDEAFLKKRLSGGELEHLVKWERRIGGKYGCPIGLPAGTYSDDTQLRLAVSRSISNSGKFLIDAFSRIELPVWRSYALGGGIGSKAAAENLTKASNRWFSNFFKKGKADYFKSGGNGAAMRIQPHVWASKRKDHPDTFLLNVLCDAIITHGHPRGFLGAVFHALCLALVLVRKQPISPNQWEDCLMFLERVPELVTRKLELRDTWLPHWEERAGITLIEAVKEIQNEYKDYIQSYHKITTDDPVAKYEEFVKSIGAQFGNEVGSGTKTTIAAAAAAYLFSDMSPEKALTAVARTLGTDTDTIGTMAGALIGVVADEPPTGLLDEPYLNYEASRLACIAEGGNADSFVYPSLIKWTAPKTLLDMVGNFDNSEFIAGLGRITFVDTPTLKGNSDYKWGLLDFGQTVLVKTRKKVKAFPTECWGTYKSINVNIKEEKSHTQTNEDSHQTSYKLPLFKSTENQTDDIQDNAQEQPDHNQPQQSPVNALGDSGFLYHLLKEAKKSNYASSKIGNHIKSLGSKPRGNILAALYASEIARLIQKGSA